MDNNNNVWDLDDLKSIVNYSITRNSNIDIVFKNYCMIAEFIP